MNTSFRFFYVVVVVVALILLGTAPVAFATEHFLPEGAVDPQTFFTMNSPPWAFFLIGLLVIAVLWRPLGRLWQFFNKKVPPTVPAREVMEDFFEGE